MAAPDFVPTDPNQIVRGYQSPPRRNRSWAADRPGDVGAGQPVGPRLGSQGPDQGFAYKLVDSFELHLGNVNRDDAIAACVGIATKRSGSFARGPMIDDVAIGFTVWGFLDPAPEADLVELREHLFAEIRSSHHYVERREVIDMVGSDVLALDADQVGARYASGWANVIGAPGH